MVEEGWLGYGGVGVGGCYVVSLVYGYACTYWDGDWEGGCEGAEVAVLAVRKGERGRERLGMDGAGRNLYSVGYLIPTLIVVRDFNDNLICSS